MMSHPDLPAISAVELAAGEHVRWSGRPDPLASMVSKAALAGFAVLWLAIAISGLSSAIPRGDGLAMLITACFVAIGIVMLFAPLFDYRSARGTSFAITDRRLIVVRARGRSITSIQLSGIRQVERVLKRGRITLRIPTALVSDGDGGQKVDYTILHGLADGDRAYRLLTQHRA